MQKHIIICSILITLTLAEWPLPSYNMQGTRLFPSSTSKSTLACMSESVDVALSWPSADNVNTLIDDREVELSPLIDDKAIYTISKDNHNVTSVDPILWAPIWNVNLVGDTKNKIISPLSMKNNIIYLIIGKENTSLIALNASTGEIMWKTPTSQVYEIIPSTIIPHKDGFLLTYVRFNGTHFGLAAIKQTDSLNFEDYILWKYFLNFSGFSSYATPPLVSEDEEMIYFFAAETFGLQGLYQLSKNGDFIANISHIPIDMFSRRAFLRNDGVVVFTDITSKGSTVIRRTIFIDTIQKTTVEVDRFSVYGLGPNNTMLCSNGAKKNIFLSTYNYSEIIWEHLEISDSIAATIDANGAVYIGVFADSNQGSYVKSYRLSDGKLFWTGNADTPMQWSISHFKNEYILLIQSRGKFGKISNKKYCNEFGGVCTEDGCKCNDNYYLKGCFKFCEKNATCGDLGLCNNNGDCEFFCKNATFCNNRAKQCTSNHTCACENDFWSLNEYSGDRCQIEKFNVTFLGIVIGSGVGFLVIMIVVIVACCCKKTKYTEIQ